MNQAYWGHLQAQNRCMQAYCQLAQLAVEEGELRWPGKPKFHAPRQWIYTNFSFLEVILPPKYDY